MKVTELRFSAANTTDDYGSSPSALLIHHQALSRVIGHSALLSGVWVGEVDQIRVESATLALLHFHSPHSVKVHSYINLLSSYIFVNTKHKTAR